MSLPNMQFGISELTAKIVIKSKPSVKIAECRPNQNSFHDFRVDLITNQIHVHFVSVLMCSVSIFIHMYLTGVPICLTVRTTRWSSWPMSRRITWMASRAEWRKQSRRGMNQDNSYMLCYVTWHTEKSVLRHGWWAQSGNGEFWYIVEKGRVMLRKTELVSFETGILRRQFWERAVLWRIEMGTGSFSIQLYQMLHDW